ncbi:hypothetical protein PPERSA_08246 [Pseudocohnilembus persalinus]|uniref:protein-tyrosine-phosphatase n=1 Tax=Pseudocohnilembus persalinus TaxID=266149 RepID=A0A0V0QG06_PSEPJ|nr:hypothetical protein PPERSA_08246 [Pseudocohnilembus persalinus]|eukprot:KRX01145.1 hypothetical protein PPERSA_08246 [Pseudocohnilembus persalinus]
MSKILDYLYVGDASTAKNLKKLQQLGITHVLNMAKEIPDQHQDKFQYLHINAIDSNDYDITQHFKETNDFIHEAAQNQGKIYIHCAYGISRAPITAMAYLIGKLKYGFYKAKHLVEKSRQETHPSIGFVQQIEKYSEIIKNEGRVTQQTQTKDQQQNKQMEQLEQKQNQNINTNINNIKQQRMNIIQNQQQKETLYKCQKCRKQLFTQSEIVHEKKDPFKDKCTSIFVDQPNWIQSEDLYSNDSKFLCPFCKNKLGEIKQSGKSCSCGQWVAPSFQILLKSIDICKPLGNSVLK